MAATPGTLPKDIREKLTCVICLELYSDPCSLPCGHSFCRSCVSGHWNSEEQSQGSAAVYTCPTCRTNYEKRLQLHRNVTLHDLVGEERAAATGSGNSSGAGSGCCSPCQEAGARCTRHGRLLELYCSTERRCICGECTVRECREHERALAADERRAREAVLKERLLKNESQLKCTEAEMQKLEEQATTLKDTYDRSLMEISVSFDQWQKALEEYRTRAVQSVKREMTSILERAKENRAELQRRLDALGQYQHQAEELLRCADDVTFLEASSLLPFPGSSKSVPDVILNTNKVDGVTRILSNISTLILKELPNMLHLASPKIQELSELKTPATLKTAPLFIPKSELRTQLLQNYRNLTFDSNTANKYIRLSKNHQEARHTASVTSPWPYHPERFESSWQVLCTESFAEGCHYWEVKISDYFVYIGVAYGDVERKKKDKRTVIGRNGSSWSLQLQQNCHSAWANGKEWKLAAALYTNVGVHLDFSAGTLSFYGIKDKMELLHTFDCVFSAPLYPAFWIGEEVIVTLCHLP